ncbi:hypothetical protein Tco_0460273 [Tanacetum coccineum]
MTMTESWWLWVKAGKNQTHPAGANKTHPAGANQTHPFVVLAAGSEEVTKGGDKRGRNIGGGVVTGWRRWRGEDDCRGVTTWW